jgi:hypothetical protein
VPSIAACTAIADALTWRVQHPLQLTRQAWQQIKQLGLLAFDILRAGLPSTTPYIKFQRSKEDCISLIVTYTTSLCGYAPHWELLLRSNVALTPWLKRGGCGNVLLMRSLDPRGLGQKTPVGMADAANLLAGAAQSPQVQHNQGRQS